jgi:hypothetical protein
MIQEIKERRHRDRFPLGLTGICRWPVGKRGIATSTTVQTCNFSSAGLLVSFAGNNMPRFGIRVNIELAWPALLDGRIRLKFIATGRVVRVKDPLVAVAILSYKFATVASSKLLQKFKVA